MIKIRYTLTLAVIISLVFLIEYQTLIFANGQMQKESNIIMHNDANLKQDDDTIISSDSDNNTLLKPKVDVSIHGTPQNDKIRGGEGDDHIDGNNGSDQLRGEEGSDEIDGGKGNDILLGEDGNDKIKGGEGDDRISGGLGDDQLEGQTGNDKLFGGEGDDLLDGGLGNDVLLAGRGMDIMIGGFGSDTFICDRFDRLIDFDQYEGDHIIGPCSVDYLVSEEQETPKNNNIFPLEAEEVERLPTPLSPQLPQTSPYLSSPPSPLNPFDMPSLSDEDLQRIPPTPIPSLKF